MGSIPIPEAARGLFRFLAKNFDRLDPLPVSLFDLDRVGTSDDVELTL